MRSQRPERFSPTPWSLRFFLAAALVVATPPTAGAQDKPTDDPIEAALHRAPADGGVRRWRAAPGGEIRLRASPSEAAPVVVTAPEGAILSNLGCAMSEERLWCEVTPFRGGKRGFAPASRLLPARAANGETPMGLDDSRRRARHRDFDAKAEIACAQERGQPLGRCGAAVARSGGGDATVVVTFPNGFERRLYFVHGEFISASATMSGAGRDTDWRLEDGLHRIRVDDQRYEAPDALIYGD